MDFKKADFNEWYNEITEAAKLVDKRYPIKGMDVWLPYGWQLMQNIDSYFRQIFKEKNYEEVYFPLLIPKTQFDKEEEHIKGFGGQVFWVTKGGNENLDELLLLRPTSETAMYSMFSLWIRAHTDLPLKQFQIVNVFRYETKQTRTFIRVREIHFLEGHTAHESAEESDRQIKEDLEIWKRICDILAIPYIINQRPDWDKFPGAYYTLASDIIMPNGRPLQIATIHQYYQNFSIPYDIKYADENGKHHYVHQTTFGISERVVGAVVGMHGDDRGLILPPKIAPIQVVIIPIVGEKKEEVLEKARELKNELEKEFRVKLDDRDGYTPGYKFYDWELKGVPLRIEIGPRDIEKEQIIFVRRDNFGKIAVPNKECSVKVRVLLEEIQRDLKVKAEKLMNSQISEKRTLDELKNEKKVARVYWCGSKECSDELELKTEKSILGTPMEENELGNCIVCNKPNSKKVYVGKPY